jgi:predicted DNA-binding mobile mystery protein A
MPRKKTDLLRRDQLQRRFETLSPMLPPPHGGWIKNLRESLGMSLRQLAGRLDISPQSLSEIEKAECEGRITLATFQKVARALSAEVQVSLRPSAPIEQMILDQARKVASRLTRNTQVHMALENQATSAAFQQDQIEKLAKELATQKLSKIWDEP